MRRLKNILGSDSGATAIEYGLIASFIAMAIYAGVIVAGEGAGTMFNLIGQVMSNAVANQ
jgi:Flp pilus assembly pilin Flp